MKRYIKSQVIQPSYRSGDVVYEGNALGYQCACKIGGDISNFPSALDDYVRNIYYLGHGVYRVEFDIDEPYLFKENYQNFENKVYPILEDSGFQILD